jgi:hypothetical protein
MCFVANSIKDFSIYFGRIPELYRILGRLQKAPYYSDLVVNTEQDKPIDSFVLAPWLHATKYRDALTEFIQFTPKCHPDYPLLCEALKILEPSVSKLNKEQGSDLCRRDLILLADRLDPSSDEKILNLTRRLLSQWDVVISKKATAVGVKPKEDGCLYLCNDLVIVTTKGERANTEILGPIVALSSLSFRPAYPDVSSISLQLLPGEWLNIAFKPSEKSAFISGLQDARELPSGPDVVTSIEVDTEWDPPQLHHVSCAIWRDRVYFAGVGPGGRNSLVCYYSFLEWFDVEPSPPGPVTGCGARIAVIGGNLCVFGGETNDRIYVQPAGAAWEQMDNIVVQRWGFSLTLFEQKCYLFGGFAAKTPTNELMIYDAGTGQSMAIKGTIAWPTPRVWHSACSYGRYIVVYGGIAGQAVFDDLWVFDCRDQKWTEINADLPPRFGHTAMIVGHTMVVIGGSDVPESQQRDCWPTPQVFTVDLAATDQMTAHELTPVGNWLSGIMHHAAAVVGDDIIVFGGWENCRSEKIFNAFLKVRIPERFREPLQPPDDWAFPQAPPRAVRRATDAVPRDRAPSWRNSGIGKAHSTVLLQPDAVIPPQ